MAGNFNCHEIARVIFGGSVALCPLIIAALGILVALQDVKRHDGISESALRKYKYAIKALVLIGIATILVNLLSLLTFLGFQDLFEVMVFLFCVVLASMALIIVGLGVLSGRSK